MSTGFMVMSEAHYILYYFEAMIQPDDRCNGAICLRGMLLMIHYVTSICLERRVLQDVFISTVYFQCSAITAW